MFRVYSLMVGYAFGCLQFAWFFGKLRNIDIRLHGSGNAGMTNVTRVLGGKFGIAVFILDMCKAALAVIVANVAFGGLTLGGSFAYMGPAGLCAGLGAAIGHNYPFYLGFRGGKGVSCTLGTVIAASWQSLIVEAFVVVPLILWKRYISLAALVGSALVPLLFFIFGAKAHRWEEVGVGFAMAALIWWRHRENIKRLIAGSESKFGGRKKKL